MWGGTVPDQTLNLNGFEGMPKPGSHVLEILLDLLICSMVLGQGDGRCPAEPSNACDSQPGCRRGFRAFSSNPPAAPACISYH